MSILTDKRLVDEGGLAVLYVSPFAEFAEIANCRGDFLQCRVEGYDGRVAQLRCARMIRNQPFNQPQWLEGPAGPQWIFDDEVVLDTESPFFLDQEEFERLKGDRQELNKWLKEIARTIWFSLQASEKPHYQDILYDYAKAFKLKRKKLILFDD